jgi:hypothetical protein
MVHHVVRSAHRSLCFEGDLFGLILVCCCIAVSFFTFTSAFNATLFALCPSFQITLKSQSNATCFGLTFPSSGNCSLVENLYTTFVSTLKHSNVITFSLFTLKYICLGTQLFILSCPTLSLRLPCFLCCFI